MRQTVTLRVHVAWWLAPYIRCLAFVSAVTGLEADPEKLDRVIKRALSVRVVR